MPLGFKYAMGGGQTFISIFSYRTTHPSFILSLGYSAEILNLFYCSRNQTKALYL